MSYLYKYKNITKKEAKMSGKSKDDKSKKYKKGGKLMSKKKKNKAKVKVNKKKTISKSTLKRIKILKGTIMPTPHIEEIKEQFVVPVRDTTGPVINTPEVVVDAEVVEDRNKITIVDVTPGPPITQ
jgi:hypothetical protein